MSFLKPYAIFRDTNLLYYFSSNITYFWQKYSIKEQIFRFFTTWVRIHQILHVIFQTKSEFSLNFGSLFSVVSDNSSVLWVIILLYFFSWNCTWFGELENSTAHVRFHQICTLIGSLKLVSAIFYQIFIFSSDDRPSKTMKNVFYLI